MKKNLVKIIGGLFILVLSLIVWIMNSPKPVIWLTRRSIFPIAIDEREKQYEKDGVSIQANIEYPSKFLNNQFDYYEAVNPHEDNPTIIWVHGGGFVGGSRIDIEEYAVELAKEGYHVIVMGYELAPEATYPTPVIQMEEMFKFLQDNEEEWNFNLDNLFLAGDSAGAQISSQFAMIQTDSDYAELMEMQPILNAEQIRGMLLFSGAFDVDGLLESDSRLINFIFSKIGWAYLGTRDWSGSDLANSASIIQHVGENFPSSYITDGNTMSFESQSKELVARLESLGVEVKSRFFDIEEFETMHVFHFDLEQEASKLVFDDVINFLTKFRL